MNYKTDAYELAENPLLTSHVKVIMPNDEVGKDGRPTGRKVEAVMEYRQLLDAKGKILPNIKQIEPGYYQWQ